MLSGLLGCLSLLWRLGFLGRLGSLVRLGLLWRLGSLVRLQLIEPSVLGPDYWFNSKNLHNPEFLLSFQGAKTEIFKENSDFAVTPSRHASFLQQRQGIHVIFAVTLTAIIHIFSLIAVGPIFDHPRLGRSFQCL